MQACSWSAPCYLPVSASNPVGPSLVGQNFGSQIPYTIKSKNTWSLSSTPTRRGLVYFAIHKWLGYIWASKRHEDTAMSWRNDEVSKLTLTKVNFCVLDKQRIVNINIHYCFVALRYICIRMHSRYLIKKIGDWLKIDLKRVYLDGKKNSNMLVVETRLD